jgi:hypothetical protein
MLPFHDLHAFPNNGLASRRTLRNQLNNRSIIPQSHRSMNTSAGAGC